MNLQKNCCFILQVTTGSYFVGKGYFSEADGDQPGSLARLRKEISLMGFTPLAYVNIKGFLNLNPNQKDMEYWSKKQKLRLEQVVSFTDGSKLQIEQALVANAFSATIAKDGLIGKAINSLDESDFLCEISEKKNEVISDFVVCPSAPPGVFILAKHPEMNRIPDWGPINKLVTKTGKCYLLLKPYHLCHLEVPRMIIEALNGGPELLNNSANPTIGVAAIAKKSLKKDSFINKALGSYEFRGEAVKIEENLNHVPISFLEKVRLIRDVEPGQKITFEDVELPQTRAFEVYSQIAATSINDKILKDKERLDFYKIRTPEDVSRFGVDKVDIEPKFRKKSNIKHGKPKTSST